MAGVARGWSDRLLGACILVTLLVVACEPLTPTPGETPTPIPTATATITPSPTSTHTPTPAAPPTPSPSATPTPSATPSPTPSPTPTIEPSATATPTPTPTPSPAPDPTGNLTWTVPPGWEAALSFTNQPGLQGGESASLEQPIYISWGVRNTGQRNVTQPFSTHLYLNGVYLTEWRGARVNAGSYVFIDDWDNIAEHVRLTPGEHTLTLWIDPLNEIPEENESDNILELDVSVTGTPPERSRTRLPDLAPDPLAGDGATLHINPWSSGSQSGPLSPSSPAYVFFEGRNTGLTSALDQFSSSLYVNGIHYHTWLWDYVRSDDAFVLNAASDILASVCAKPGDHVASFVIDPGDLVHEADETNNSVEIPLTCTSGPPPAAPPSPTPTPAPTPPAPLTQPNLVPHWRFGASAPIVLSNEPNTRTSDPVIAGSTVFVDVAYANQSLINAPSFSARLILDGEVVRTFSPAPLSGNLIRDLSDQALTINVPPGLHTLRLEIDPDNRVAEANETDNTYQLTFTVHEAPPPTPTPTTYTESQIEAALDDLQAAVDDRRPVLGEGGSGLESYALEVADIAYYSMTGVSIDDEPLSVLLLDDAGYREWIDRSYVDDFATSPESEFPSLLAAREFLKNETPAFKTRHEGVVAVFVNAERPFADVLSSLAHELGHAKQDFENPEQTTGTQSQGLDGILEAQAQQFERALWLTLENLSGLQLLEYPEHAAFDVYVDTLFDQRLQDYADEEHALGYLIQWLAVLADPNLIAIRSELATDGRLSASASLELFDYFVAMQPQHAPAYVNGLLDLLPTWLPTMLENAKSRTVPDLDRDLEGLPDLRPAALGSP